MRPEEGARPSGYALKRKPRFDTWVRDEFGQPMPDWMRPVAVMRDGKPAMARCPDCCVTERLTKEQVYDASLRVCPCGGALEVFSADR